MRRRAVATSASSVRRARAAPSWLPGALLLDLDELTMAESYLAEGMADLPATFSLVARRLPPGWGYLVAAGLDDALDDLEGLAFAEDDLAWLESTGRFTRRLLDRLRGLRFRGGVRAVPEGTTTQPRTPLVEISGPLMEVQLAESVVLSRVHLQSLIATSAARCVEGAAGRPLVDLALRRVHGTDAAMKVARATRLAGFAATTYVAAARAYGIPLAGTMADGYVHAFPDEETALRAFARAVPDAVLPVGASDAGAGVERVVRLGRQLAREGRGRLGGVHLDSGDLGALARRARASLDAAGLLDATIMASGGLAEREIAALVDGGAPIDAFGVMTTIGAAAAAPHLDMGYALVELEGRPTPGQSTGTVGWPGAKQVWRPAAREAAGDDVLAVADERMPPTMRPLLVEAMHDGRRLWRGGLAAARSRCLAERACLPPSARRLDAVAAPARPTPRLQALRDRLSIEAPGPRGIGVFPQSGPVRARMPAAVASATLSDDTLEREG